eukprot:scaffold3024_cov101-Isochrysis_galbana.AAC.1
MPSPCLTPAHTLCAWRSPFDLLWLDEQRQPRAGHVPHHPRHPMPLLGHHLQHEPLRPPRRGPVGQALAPPRHNLGQSLPDRGSQLPHREPDLAQPLRGGVTDEAGVVDRLVDGELERRLHAHALEQRRQHTQAPAPRQ